MVFLLIVYIKKIGFKYIKFNTINNMTTKNINYTKLIKIIIKYLH